MQRETAAIAEAEEIPRVAPFELKTLAGETFNSKHQLNGRVSIIAFWRLEQVKSMKLLKDLMELRAAFPEDELNIVTILELLHAHFQGKPTRPRRERSSKSWA